MRAVYRKELRQLFHSVIGYVFLAAFALVCAFLFLFNNLLRQDGDIRNFYAPLMSFSIFLLPLLTMRSFSEERKMHTDVLLRIAPVDPVSVVVGKFLALITVFGIGLAGTLLFVLALSFFGSFDPVLTIGCLVGCAVSGACFIAVGIFLSSLTENQVVACVISYAVLLGLWLIGSAGSYVTNPVVKSLLSALSLSRRFGEFSMGLFDISTLVYYLSVTAFFLFLTSRVLRSYSQSQLSLPKRFFDLLPSLLALALLLSCNLFVGKASARFGGRLDLTDNRLYTLSEESKEAVQNLPNPVTVSVFSAEDEYLSIVREILNHYERDSGGRIRVTYIDPLRNPSEVDRYTQRGLDIRQDSLTVEGEYSCKVLQTRDLFTLTADGTGIESLHCEQALTSAVCAVSGTRGPSAVFLTGHGETIEDSLTDLFLRNNYDVSMLSPALSPLEEGVDLAVLSSPKSDYTKEEVKVLSDYLDKGGRLLCFAGPTAAPLSNLYSLFSDYGIRITDTLVAESGQYTGGNPLNVVPLYASHPINEYFSGNQIFPVLPSAVAVEPIFVKKGNIRTSKLLYSTDHAYDYNRNDGTHTLYTLACTSERTTENSSCRLAVIGSEGITQSSLLQSSSYANAKFIMRTAAWCTETGSTLTIPDKSLSSAPLRITFTQLLLSAFCFTVLLPGGILVFALLHHRRRKRS